MEAEQKERVSLKKVIDADLRLSLIPVRHLIRRWYLQVGMKFLNGRNITDTEEKFLEDFTDFCLDDISNIK